MPAVTFKGNPVELSGAEVKAGDAAPDFALQSQALEDLSLSTFAGKTLILASVPSLDTSVCAVETKRFNDEVAKLDGVEVVVASMDLPFGAKRWCGSEGVENVQTGSDHRDASFGEAYGVLIKGGALDRIHTRAVFVVGPDGVVKYAEYCPEIAEHPNYEAAIAAATA